MSTKVGKFGEYKRLKTALFGQKVTYKEAAEMIGISVSAFNNKINGRVDFKLDEMLKLCDFLDLDYYFIMDEKLQNATKEER